MRFLVCCWGGRCGSSTVNSSKIVGFAVLKKMLKESPKSLQNGGRKGAKSDPGPPRTVPRGRSKNGLKNYAKWAPKGNPSGGQMGAKIDEKGCLKTESIPRVVPWSPWEVSGTILGAFSEHFCADLCVFPCVFHSFLSKTCVSSCVFTLLDIRFSLVFGRTVFETLVREVAGRQASN